MSLSAPWIGHFGSFSGWLSTWNKLTPSKSIVAASVRRLLPQNPISSLPCCSCPSSTQQRGHAWHSISPAFKQQPWALKGFLSCFCNSVNKSKIQFYLRAPAFSPSSWSANWLSRYLHKPKKTVLSHRASVLLKRMFWKTRSFNAAIFILITFQWQEISIFWFSSTGW